MSELITFAENITTAQTTGSSQFGVAGYLPVSLSDVVVGAKDLLVVQHQRNMSTNYWLATVSSWVYRPMDDGLLQFSVVGHPSTVTLMTALAPTQVYQVVRWLPLPDKVSTKFIDEHADHMTFHYRDRDETSYIHPVFRWMSYWDTHDVTNVKYYTSDPVRGASFEPQTSAVSQDSTLPPIPGAEPSAPSDGSGFKPQPGRFDTVSSSTFWGSTDNEEDNNV